MVPKEVDYLPIILVITDFRLSVKFLEAKSSFITSSHIKAEMLLYKLDKLLKKIKITQKK